MSSVLFFLLQILFTSLIIKAIVSIWTGRLVARAADTVLPPYRVDVLKGVRGRLVATGIIILFLVGFAMAYNFNILFWGSALYSNIFSAIVGVVINLFLYSFHKTQ